MAINSSTTALLHNLFSGTNEENPLKVICLKLIKNTSFKYILSVSRPRIQSQRCRLYGLIENGFVLRALPASMSQTGHNLVLIIITE